MRFLLTVVCASHLPQPLHIPHCCLAYVMPHFWSRSGVVVIGPFHNDSAATTPRRNAGHAEVSTTGFRISDEESSSIC
jgi:hypothetical protein